MSTAEAGAATSTPADPWSSWLGSRAAVRARRGLERRADPPEPGAPSSSVVDLAANDYLGLAVHPDVRAAAARIATEGPVGARASRVVTGTHPAHADLESAAAALAGADAALAFSSGYTANLGVLGALAGPGTAFLLARVNPQDEQRVGIRLGRLLHTLLGVSWGSFALAAILFPDAGDHPDSAATTPVLMDLLGKSTAMDVGLVGGLALAAVSALTGLAVIVVCVVRRIRAVR